MSKPRRTAISGEALFENTPNSHGHELPHPAPATQAHQHPACSPHQVRATPGARATGRAATGSP
ncbi:hypothetical protein SAMN05421595_0062 [Austwickia chelonae]|uniref:Uncharacterized protein n=1 Tax=Austwickia chelonae NBRC 105200 TaxID=1184607 RepID=K6UNB9_9MICO|nr:hypothetical protein [Austwickia chelonae]GAB78851.1 hypothetical protein AUCHE_17_00630 [Austwickia chelonae NBRC 105200]SEV85301.1 hypothetical protein SAMN05421595_0062 [Austwickia chelonae]